MKKLVSIILGLLIVGLLIFLLFNLNSASSIISDLTKKEKVTYEETQTENLEEDDEEELVQEENEKDDEEELIQEEIDEENIEK